MSQNLFNMEVLLQREDYLDEMFGLSADILAADLDTDGSILGLDEFKHHEPVQEPLEDLLLQSPPGGSFGEDWMETVDFKSLLNSNATVTLDSSVPSKPVAPQIIFNSVEEPKKEGMKAAAFELLKALLTSNQPVKPELSVTVDHLFVPSTTPPVTSPVAEVPNIDFSDASSPVADTPVLGFTSVISDIDMLLDEPIFEQQESPFEQLIDIQPEISLDNGVVEIEPSSDGPLIASIELLNTLSQEKSCFIENRNSSSSYHGSPVTIEDMDSELSSAPSSPGFSTINSGEFRDFGTSKLVKCEQVSESDFTKIRTKPKKVRTAPYDPDYDNIPDKKLRKKMQNKNAATRYRVKKRSEKETLQEQEVRLADRNKELREKVESLQREIKYMKELMNEISKAKQKNI